MLSWIPAPLLGVISALLLGVNTIVWCTPLFALSILKFVLPWAVVRRLIDPWLNRIAKSWIACNSAWMLLTHRARWDVQGLEGLKSGGWYMVNCNHQSWVDIFVLQRVFNRHIPFLKFFLKQELIWVPMIGLAWWALDFPFMRRHGKAALRKNPELRHQDMETTRRSCARFALVPTSVMNFAEGTRFTPAKHAQQSSPYRHLLKPKGGALALALNVMGERFRALLDVTIVYPDGVPSYWDMACGRMGRVIVRVQEREVPAAFLQGDYSEDPEYRKEFQAWLGQIWAEKDQLIESLRQP
ncbi:1-acyl-sn-glycerol-3-phosphate acyltransferase [Inhella inkyongensis]|uniref:1-acyl-sn-glycerol-3-phosphate acyltransferase n=1 Tax=Inhella inkyongensis TaxID=392593 RepID=A0A840S5P7_9BURK|nr:acyltransferase [Inhella inkyongensis]MBB5204818.1 1-acyl-sn-glycerol-3-phosphate acyltransferase [Inhella inkyongensis]